MARSARTTAARAKGARDGHLPGQDEPVHNHVPERWLSEESGGQHQQGVKPGKKPHKHISNRKII